MFLRILLLAVTLLISCRTTDSEIKSNGLEKFPTNTIKETRDFYITISAKSIGTFSEIDKLKDRPDSISDQQIEKLDEIFEVSGQKNAILKNILQEGLVSPTNNTEAKRSEVQTSVDNIDRFNRRLRRAIAG